MVVAAGMQRALIGFGGGCCVGLVGWGGTQIVVPALAHPSIGNMPHLVASAVSISSLSVASAVSSLNYLHAGAVDLPTAASIALPSLFGARAGVLLARRLSSDVHSLIFHGASFAMLPAHLVVQRHRSQTGSALEDGTKPTSHTSSTLASAASFSGFGFVAGATSAVLGVGGGPLVVSFLSLITPLPHHLVQGTAACAVLPSMIASGAMHAHHGSVPFAAAAAVTAGGVAGSVCGAQLALHLSEERLRMVYVASLLLLGGRSFVAAGQKLAAIMSRLRIS